MLAKHRSEFYFKAPFQRAYFKNQYGAKSLGEPEWKPHVRNALNCPNCQEHSPKGGNGLDWFSTIRCPEPVIPKKEEHLKFNITKNRQLYAKERVQEDQPKEPPGCKQREAEKELSNGIYEISLEKRMGRRKKVQDVRNGIKRRAPGDKSYYVPEYEKGFHSYGCTLPVINFGASSKIVPDTFIPLLKLPLKPRIPFHVKEKNREKTKEIIQVKELDLWKPAEPLL